MTLAVCVSGDGSNLQALLDAGLTPRVVVSDREGIRALARARAAGLETVVVPPPIDPLDAVLQSRGVTLVALAGYRRILPPAFVAAWRGRVVNLHPSLLPAFPGLHAIRDALRAGVRKTGVTVHLVDEGVDTGPVLAQAALDVLPGDSEASLAARIHAVEHALFPAVVAQLAAGSTRVDWSRISLPPFATRRSGA